MIRYALLGLGLVASDGVACPMPQGSIPLVSGDPNAPLSYALMGTPPLSAPFDIKITFCDWAKPPQKLAFDANMPAHQHGMNFDVDVAQTGTNQFDVSNVVFHMPGLWEIQVAAEFDGETLAYKAVVALE